MRMDGAGLCKTENGPPRPPKQASFRKPLAHRTYLYLDKVQASLIICRFCSCKFALLLIFICILATFFALSCLLLVLSLFKMVPRPNAV